MTYLVCPPLPPFSFVKFKSNTRKALYNPHGRYRFRYGINWRAAIAFLVPVAPLLPGLAYSITPSISISQGAKNLYTFDWLFGFVVSIVLYTGLSLVFPAKDTVITETIWDYEMVDGVVHSDEEKAGSTGTGERKAYHESDAKPL